MAIYRFAFPTDIHFGAGARREAWRDSGHIVISDGKMLDPILTHAVGDDGGDDVVVEEPEEPEEPIDEAA